MHSTKLILADNSNRSVVTNRLADSKQGNAYGVSVEDLTIDGNRWGQWGLNWSEKPSYELSEPHIKQSHGVLLHRLPTNKDGSIDSYSLIQNVHVQFTWGSAFNTREHGGEVRVINCHARRVGGHGFVTGWDMQVHNCTSGESEYDGFRVQHGSTVISSCKAFRAGVMAHDGLREGIAYPGKEAAGFHFSGAGHVIGVGLNAQNNTGAGIVLESVRGVALYGILSDSNNMQAVTEWEGKWPWVSREYYNHKAQLAAEKASGKDSSWRIAKPDSFDSVEFRGNASHCIVEGISWASQAQGGYPIGFNHHAVSFQEGCHTNRVSLSHRSEDGNNPRRAGGILNKKKTLEMARLKNRITDHLGNDYGMLPWTMENLEIPVISRNERSKYQSPNKKIIDRDKGILLWYRKETNQWIRTTDGKPD